MQLAIIVVYLALLLALGTLSHRLSRGTSQDYMLASHSIGPVLLLLSLFGTTMTAFALVGSTGKAFEQGAGVYGMLASSSGILHSLCFYLVGVQLWKHGRRYGFTTQIQFFRSRLENNFIGLLLFPLLVGLVIPYLLIGVLSAGALMSEVPIGEHTMPRWTGSLSICLVVLAYVFFGGMRGTAWANALQTLFFMTMGVVTFVTIANGLGEQGSLWESMKAATASADETRLTRESLSKPVYFSFLLIPLSVATFPHVFQHWLTARSAATFKLPIVAHPIFILIVWVPCVLIGVWASGAGLGEDANPNTVLAVLVQSHASEALAGLLTAGILAAIMSSLDSQFLCLGTIFTEDIVVHYAGEKTFTDKQVVLLARSFIAAIVAVTFFFSLVAPRSVFDMGIWCFSGFTGLFPLVVAALYWRRLTAPGAIAGVLTTAAIWGWAFYQSDFASHPYALPEKPITIAGTVVIPPMFPVVTIFAASAVMIVVVSLFTRPPSEATLKKFFEAPEEDLPTGDR